MMFKEVYEMIKGAKGVFVNSILSKFYLVIAIPAMYVVYIVFTKFQEIGLIDMLLTQLQSNLKEIQYYAEHCSSKILDIKEFLRCFSK